MASHSHSYHNYPPSSATYGSALRVMEDPALQQTYQRKHTPPMAVHGSSSSPPSPPYDHGNWTYSSPNVDTDGSDFSASSPPASDDGFVPTYPMQHGAIAPSSAAVQDWDLLSEMLIDDALSSMHTAAPTTQGYMAGNQGYDAFGAPPKPLIQQHQQHQQQQTYQPLAYHPQQQYHQHQQHQQNQQNQQQRGRTVAPHSSMGPGFMDALLMQDDAALASSASKRNAVGSPQTTDLFPPLPTVGMPMSSSSASECASESDSSPTQSPQASHAKARKTTASSSAASSSSSKVKSDPNMSAEEMKKLRRRSQIASSVQRHREKKKCLVATLKQDLSSLTAQLDTLRSQRKSLHADNERLVEWEEEAITQRRKRKQSEELNQRMKKALFQQTCFLMGMRSIMGNLPAPKEMQIHDWLHSYTVLTGRDVVARRKEYLSFFSDSKMDMAYQIVLRETDPVLARLTLANPYYSEIRVLHDGTEELCHEEDLMLKKELREETEFVVPGTGQVAKKYTSMFLFEERGNCTIEAFKHVALEATKSVGVFWPSPGYYSNALETIDLDENSQMMFSDLHGSMSIIDEQLTSDDQDVQVEARMMCRVLRTENDTIIVWDYADKDELFPIQGERSIRRDSSGAALVRREPGGKISFRSVAVKMFGPLDTNETSSNDLKALTQRRINLQASELERKNQKCVRSIYDSLASAFTKSVSLESSA